jgi:hypothetical protein
MFKEFYQELRNSGKKGTWQVFDQELDFFGSLLGGFDCCRLPLGSSLQAHLQEWDQGQPYRSFSWQLLLPCHSYTIYAISLVELAKGFW